MFCICCFRSFNNQLIILKSNLKILIHSPKSLVVEQGPSGKFLLIVGFVEALLQSLDGEFLSQRLLDFCFENSSSFRPFFNAKVQKAAKD